MRSCSLLTLPWSLLAPQFGLNPGVSFLALLLGFMFAFVGVNASGTTDTNPVGVIAKAGQLIIGGVTKGQGISVQLAQRTSLVAGSIVGQSASHSVDMVGDLKTGHLIGASPRAQFWAQLAGSAGEFLFLSSRLFLLQLPRLKLIPLLPPSSAHLPPSSRSRIRLCPWTLPHLRQGVPVHQRPHDRGLLVRSPCRRRLEGCRHRGLPAEAPRHALVRDDRRRALDRRLHLPHRSLLPSPQVCNLDPELERGRTRLCRPSGLLRYRHGRRFHLCHGLGAHLSFLNLVPLPLYGTHC
jgi:hypothetical protein